MTVDLIQLPPDSTGKKVAARSYTENANTVYAQAGYLTTDTALGNPVEVKQTTPAADAYGLAVRTLGDDTATLFYDQVEGSALNTNLWTGSNATQTITQANGFINLNAGAITTTTTHSRLASVKSLPRFGYFPMVGRFGIKVTNPTATNQNMEIGFAVASGATAPTDGAFFRWDSTGLKAIVSFNSTETASSALSGVSAGTVSILEVHMIGRKAIFVIDGVVAATLTATAGNSGLTSVDRLPIHARVTNSGTASAAPGLSISRVTILQSDLAWNKPWADQISDSQSKGSFQSPLTTFGQTANWGNGAAPTTRTIANTTAGEATLGGLIAFTPTYTANNDYILFAYQVPAGYEFHINSVTVGGPFFVSGTGAATATLFIWGMAVGSSAVSLATADALGPPPTAWGPRRFALGASTQAASPTVATFPSPPMIQQTFAAPIVCDAGRYVHIFVRTTIARTAGASEVQYAMATINGYFE